MEYGKYGVVKAICIFVLLILSANSTYAYDFKKVTDDERIVSALKVLENTDSKDTLERVFQKDKNGKYVQIIFYDLGMISYNYKNHYAMTSRDNFGDKHIIINAKYRNSPKEALAALIAHESCHGADAATLNEEINATVTEAMQWVKSITLNPELQESTNPLIQRLNNLCKLYNADGESAISQKITSNEFYKSQLVRD